MNFPGLRKRIQKDILKPDGFQQHTWSLLLCTLAINLLSMALPIMTLQVYDRILPNPGTGTLPVLLTGVCLAVFLEALLRLSRSYVIGRSGATYEHLISCEAMQKILNADLTKTGSYGIGEHLHRMGSISKLRDFYNGYSLTVLAELAFVPLFFGLIVYIGHWLAIVPATVLTIFASLSLWKGYRLRNALKTREDVDDERFNFLIESLEGVHTIKSFALEKFFERRYEKLEEDSTLGNYQVTQEAAATFNMGAVFAHIMVASVITAGAWFALNNMLTTGGLIAVLLLSGRMMQPVQKALALWTRYQDFALSQKNIEEILNTPQMKVIERETGKEVFAEGRLKIENAAFKYKNDESPILKNVSLEINRGDAILISGVHGAGKTTFLNMITGIYPATEGNIYINGESINTYTPEEMVNHIGYIRSHALVFRGTIRDNITCFGQTDERQAKEIASILGVDEDVAKLPGGFDTFLSGNNTDSISPGLKQRISIARVLASKPRIILFDNADRSLDKDGYTTIYSLLARLKNKTAMILISDDKNIRGLADRHYKLEDGEFLESALDISRNNIRPYKELRL